MNLFLEPEWPKIPGVHAAMSLRQGGVSAPPFDSLNLGDHVGDNPEHVKTNRQRLLSFLGLQNTTVHWLKQVHGTEVMEVGREKFTEPPTADAAFTKLPGVACTIMTADCLPVLIANKDGGAIAAAHAGWRGLLNGILEATMACFTEPNRTQIWLGPAIGPSAFEVGEEVKAAYLEKKPIVLSGLCTKRPG